MSTSPDAGLAGVRALVDAQIARVSGELAAGLTETTPEAADLIDGIMFLMSGGKRLRPVFLWAGFEAGAGERLPTDHAAAVALATTASALEFFHAAALLHDDVMDRSDTRRAAPTMHRTMAAEFGARGWVGDAEQFGVSAAILAGDLCLAWSETVFQQGAAALQASAVSSPAAATASRALFDAMKAELMVGQYLDMAAQAAGPGHNTRHSALRVIEHKSARYTATFPLTVGARLAGAANEVVAALGRMGTAVGLAFQLRDDLLGVFGQEAATGKPVGDDLREGKQTVLLACAAEVLTAEAWAAITQHVGNPDVDDATVAWVQQQLRDCGAVAAVEQLITDYAATAQDELDNIPIPDTVRNDLSSLVDKATNRSH